MTIDLERLEELAKKATPGPWISRAYAETKVPEVVGPVKPNDMRDRIALCALGRDRDQTWSNFNYIAAVSPDVVLSLITELRELRDKNDGLQASLNEIQNAVRERGSYHP